MRLAEKPINSRGEDKGEQIKKLASMGVSYFWVVGFEVSSNPFHSQEFSYHS
jgi:hypothetical protein